MKGMVFVPLVGENFMYSMGGGDAGETLEDWEEQVEKQIKLDQEDQGSFGQTERTRQNRRGTCSGDSSPDQRIKETQFYF